jgi:hypothetical protein
MTDEALADRTPATIRVAVADDHPAFRAGLRSLIQDSPLLTFVGGGRWKPGHRSRYKRRPRRLPDGRPDARIIRHGSHPIPHQLTGATAF